MNQLRVLLYKEWRDQRALVLGGITLSLAVFALARALSSAPAQSWQSASLALCACEWTFAVALAVELISRDVAHRVDGTLLRLPVPRHLAWRAKVVFLVLASAVLHLALLLGEITARLLEHTYPLEAFRTMYQPANWLYGGVLASAALASACVLRRSLPAAFVGVAAVATLPLLASHLLEGRARDWLDLLLNSWTRTAFATIACAALLFGSFLAFRVRREDPSGWRRAASVAVGLGLVFVPLFAGTASACSWALDILPFSKRAEIERVAPSPDGRFLAVQVRQDWKPRDAWIDFEHFNEGLRQRREVWLFDRENRKWNTIDGLCRKLARDEFVWDEAGKLHTCSDAGAFGYYYRSEECIDPATLEVQTLIPVLAKAERTWCSRRSASNDTVLWSWRGHDSSLRLPARAVCVASPQPGVWFHEQDGFLVRHELDPETTTRLAPLQPSARCSVEVSPAGRYLWLVDGRDGAILDACDGTRLQELGADLRFDGWSNVRGRIARLRAHGVWLALEEDGQLARVPAPALNQRALGRDALVRFEPQHIEITSLDGRERETIYEVQR